MESVAELILSSNQARLRCAPPHGAARAALWLEAPRARARSDVRANCICSGGSSRLPHFPASAGTRRERSAWPAAMAFGHSRLNPAESRRSGSYRDELPSGSQPRPGKRSVRTYCFIVSYVGVAYPPAESP
jgi:hypothetical protein